MYLPPIYNCRLQHSPRINIHCFALDEYSQAPSSADLIGLLNVWEIIELRPLAAYSATNVAGNYAERTREWVGSSIRVRLFTLDQAYLYFNGRPDF
jgi:hypothetical protein